MVPKLKAPDLPAELKPLFWDYDFARLTWEKDSDVITGRILTRGDWEATHWLVGMLGRDGIREWIVRRRGRGLDARALRFWELVAGVPHGKVNEWLSEQAGLSWTTRIRR